MYHQPLSSLALNAAGFSSPTTTQAQVWPIALSGRDVITVAKTGSGIYSCRSQVTLIESAFACYL